MKFINVITYHNDVGIVDITTFVETDPQLSGETAEEAEQFFIDKVVKISGVEPKSEEADDWREIAYDALEDGWLDVDGTYVYIVHSYPENI